MSKASRKKNIRTGLLIAVTFILMLFVIVPVLWFILVSLQAPSRIANRAPWNILGFLL